MPPVTEVLRESHRLRKHIIQLQSEIDRGPRVLKSRQEELEAERQAHKDHHDSITKLKLKQREDEGSLKQTDTRLAKLEDQLTGITVQKEFDAKKSEIAQAQTKKSDLEDSILASLMDLEERTAAIPAVEKKWADAQAEFAQYKVEAADRLEMLKNELEASRVALAKVEVDVPDAIRPRYEKLTKAHGPDAMAGVKNKTCLFCRTGVTDQRLIEIREGLFFQCSTCGKMLFPAE